MRKILFTSLVVLNVMLISFSAVAAEASIKDRVLEIMAMEHRNDADTARDKNRAPHLALEFMGIKDDMKVIEFAPGNGWYSKILAPLLQNKGELHMAYKKEWLDDLDDIFAIKVMSKAKKLPIELDWNDEEYRYVFGNKIDFGIRDADMFLCIREYHNFGADDKARFNKAVYDTLNPGGIYVVIDHSRRHMAPETWEVRRREDAVKVILEIQAAGFQLVKSSDMFYRPDDELIHEVGRHTVTGNTDRFNLVFRKPE